MNLNPKVAIIIVFKNVEKYLGVCIESILLGNYENFHIILIDNGSTDNSSKIAYDYLNNNDKITYHYSHHNYLGEVRNYSLSVLNKLRSKHKFKYFTMIDGDDYISEFYLSRMVNIAESNKSKIVVSNFMLRYGDEYLPSENLNVSNWKKIILNDTLGSFNWGKLIHIDYLPYINYQDHLICLEDVIPMTNLCLDAVKYNRISYSPNTFYIYRRYHNSATGYLSQVKIINMMEVINNLMSKNFSDYHDLTKLDKFYLKQKYTTTILYILYKTVATNFENFYDVLRYIKSDLKINYLTIIPTKKMAIHFKNFLKLYLKRLFG